MGCPGFLQQGMVGGLLMIGIFFYGLSKLEVVISLVTTVLVIPIFMVVAERIADRGSCQCNLIILGIPSF